MRKGKLWDGGIKTPIQELEDLATYAQGMADATGNDRLDQIAEWLNIASQNICAQGYFGCKSGAQCTSDHK